MYAVCSIAFIVEIVAKDDPWIVSAVHLHILDLIQTQTCTCEFKFAFQK